MALFARKRRKHEAEPPTWAAIAEEPETAEAETGAPMAGEAEAQPLAEVTEVDRSMEETSETPDAFFDPVPSGPFGYDVGSAIDCGGRDYQEDALVTDFHLGENFGIVILADGMGGHAAGNVASKIVVTRVFDTLKSVSEDFVASEDKLPEIIEGSVLCANEAMGEHVQKHPETDGMGSTVVAAVMIEEKLYWTSVGDSPLYLFRDGELRRINEDHSMAPQIDFMVKSGMMTPEEAANHPNRNCLTSALTGTEIARINTRDEAFELEHGDILVISSDGLQYLEDHEITALIKEHRRSGAREIAATLMKAVLELEDPYQDNVSLAVVKVERTARRHDVKIAVAADASHATHTRLILGQELN